MGLVKILKTKTYFARFQVKPKRRRECKTDYRARKKLILQDKNKYKTRKYRFVVRFTNKDIVCQIFSSDITHDECMVAAYSHELPRYGVKLGLTNYPAAYCTGLLLARRLNKKLSLDYEGTTEDIGEYFEVEANEEGPRPFCAVLDVGLKPTTTGSRLFGALKGAVDGGIDIPHGDRRFPRPKSDGGKEYEADAEFHRKYIFGGHVADFMNKLKDDDEEAYKKQFGRYIAEGIEPDDLEGIYEAAHKAIREDPNKPRGGLERGRFCTREKPKDKDFKYEHKKWPAHPVKLTCDERKKREIEKLKLSGLRAVPRTSSYKRKRLLPPVVKKTYLTKEEKKKIREARAAKKEAAKHAGDKLPPEERAKRKAAKLKKFLEVYKNSSKRLCLKSKNPKYQKKSPLFKEEKE